MEEVTNYAAVRAGDALQKIIIFYTASFILRDAKQLLKYLHGTRLLMQRAKRDNVRIPLPFNAYTKAIRPVVNPPGFVFQALFSFLFVFVRV